MPQSRYAHLDEKLEKIIAVLGEHSTFHALNAQEHDTIVKSVGTLVEQGRVRNGRLEKLEDRCNKTDGRWKLLMGGWFILSAVMGYFLTKVFEHLAP